MRAPADGDKKHPILRLRGDRAQGEKRRQKPDTYCIFFSQNSPRWECIFHSMPMKSEFHRHEIRISSQCNFGFSGMPDSPFVSIWVTTRYPNAHFPAPGRLLIVTFFSLPTACGKVPKAWPAPPNPAPNKKPNSLPTDSEYYYLCTSYRKIKKQPKGIQ